MNQKPKLTLAVTFPESGAVHHPAFSSAYRLSDGTYRIEYIRCQGYLTSRAAQTQWAEDKVKHLRSWGTVGTISELQK